MLKEPDRNVSFAEFVAWEQGQADCHELIGGRVVRFLAGSLDHESIAVNVIAKLHAALEPPCRVFGSTAIVQTVSRISEDGYRPDVTVSCSPANVGNGLYVRDPRIVVEVLSPSNIGPDWNAKLFEYWNTSSIEQLVLIESRQRHVTSYLRDIEHSWQPALFITDGTLEFSPIGIAMSLDNVYRNTSLTSI